MPSLDDGKKPGDDPPLTTRRVAVAWMPFALMSVLLLGAGMLRQKEDSWIAAASRDPAFRFPTLAGLQSTYLIEVPGLHLATARDPELLREDLADGYVTEAAARRDYGIVDSLPVA